MTEEEWLTGNDPTPMLTYLHGKVSERKFRLLGCACSRRIWDFISDFPTRRIIEAVENLVEGLAKPATIGKLRKQACGADTRFFHGYNLAVRNASAKSTIEVLIGAARLQAWEQGWGIRQEKYHDETIAQVLLLRDIFGNPFRPIVADPAWLTPTVQSIAAAIYQDRAFDRLPILADALEEAGCTNADVLLHCRQPGEHVRGCWVVDLVLGKK